MKLLASSLFAAAALAAAAAGPAAAQGGRQPSITLFEGPNFSGPSRTFTANVANLGNTGFNDRALSAQVRGAWRVCMEANLKGRCATLERDIGNLEAVGLARSISSIEFDGGGFGGGAGPGRPPGSGFPGPGGPGPGGGFDPGQRLEGRSAVFFPNPRGPGGGRRAADEFCQRMGLGQSLYSDDRSADLRDVLCERR